MPRTREQILWEVRSIFYQIERLKDEMKDLYNEAKNIPDIEDDEEDWKNRYAQSDLDCIKNYIS